MFEETAFQELIEKGTEVRLYFVINELGGFLFRTRHYMGRLVPETEEVFRSIAEARGQIERAVAKTTRFGVARPFRDGEDKTASDEYWLWFRWWDNWAKGLSDEQFRRIDEQMSAGLDAKIRPRGDWRRTAKAAVPLTDCSQ